MQKFLQAVNMRVCLTVDVRADINTLFDASDIFSGRYDSAHPFFCKADIPMTGSSSTGESIVFRHTIVLLSVVLFLGIFLMPEIPGLSLAGQRLAAVGTVMALLWSTQAMPMAITSLIPLFTFPLLQIQTADVVSRSYMNSTIMLFLSGFAIAIGVERWGLHRRLALLCLCAIGTGPRRIVLAFMLGTAMVSMWLSNTAAALLMFPIALAVLGSLEAQTANGTGAPAAAPLSNGTSGSRKERGMAIALMLGIAYAASIGGMCTLIGSPTNGVYVGYWASTGLPPEVTARYTISSGQWLLMFAPLSVLLLLMAWWIVCWPIPRDTQFGSNTREELVKQYRDLGPMKSGERRMLLVFLAVAFLWLSRATISIGSVSIPGWEAGIQFLLTRWVPDLNYTGWLHDSTAGMLMMFVMFLIPVKDEVTRQPGFLMDWRTIEAKTPWGVLLLFGGGFALANACTTTGLSNWMGDGIAQRIGEMGTLGQMLSVTALVNVLTEFTSNTATASTLLPILHKTALALEIDPRLLMLPATISASCAFMLPIATPPNAIVFSSNRLKVSDMLLAGFWLNIISIFLVTFVTLYWSMLIVQTG